MTRNQRFVAAAVFGATLFIGGCGDGAKPPSGGGAAASGASTQAPPAVVVVPAPPAAMVALLPERTAAFVYVANVQALEAAARRIAASVRAELSAGVDLAALAASFASVDPGDIDMTQGAMIAITFAAGADVPGFTAIVAVRDPAATVAKIEAQMPGVPTDIAGPFVAVTPTRGYKRGGMPAWASGPHPAGDLVIRLDVPTLMKTLGPAAFAAANKSVADMAALTTAQPGAGDPTAPMRLMLDGLRATLDESAVWDLALRGDGTGIEADLLMRWKDAAAGGRASMFTVSDLAALARGVADDGMFTAAISVDLARMMTATSPLLTAQTQAFAPGDRELVAKYLEAWGHVLKVSGPGMIASGGFGSGGLEVTTLTTTTDPKAYLAAVGAALGAVASQPSFVKTTPHGIATVDGTPVSRWHTDVDVDKLTTSRPAGMSAEDQRKMMTAMYGEKGLDFRVAELGDRVLSVMGGDDLLARALKAAKRPRGAADGALAQRVVAAGPDTVGYLSVDMRAVIRAFSALLPQPESAPDRPTSKVPAGDPVPITVILNAPPGALRGRLSLDIGKVAAMIKSAMPK